MWDQSHAFVAVVDGHALLGVVEAHELAGESASGQDAASSPAHVAGGGDLSQAQVIGIDRLGQAVWPLAWGGAPSGRGGLAVEGFVRSQGVVNVSPALGVLMEVFDAVASDAGVEFVLEGAVQAFDLALCLGVIGSAVDGVDVQSQEAAVEPTDGSGVAEGGGELVVAEDALWHSHVGEGVPEDLEDARHGVVVSEDQPQEIA